MAGGVPIVADEEGVGKMTCPTELRGDDVSSGSNVKPPGAGANIGGDGETDVGAVGGTSDPPEICSSRWASGIRERRTASKLRVQEG